MSGLQVENIHLWRGDRQVLDSVSFSAEAGQLVHVSGANGAGKTTLLRVLCGLSLAEEGTISWQGQAVNDDLSGYRDKIVFLGHKDGINDELSARENLHYLLALEGYRPLRKTVNIELDALQMLQQSELPARVLSAGQRRRAALAHVFLSPAVIWILDEPYTHLDKQGQGVLNERISKHLQDNGIVIVTTHDSSLLPRTAHTELAI